MRLTRLRIRNFKGLADFEISDLPRFIVLFGPNGSGKTTLLKALMFLRLCMVHDVRAAEQYLLSPVSKLTHFANPASPLLFEFDVAHADQRFSYLLQLTSDKNGEGEISSETLSATNQSFRREGQKTWFQPHSASQFEELAKVPLDLDPKTSVLSLYARWTGGEIRSLWNYVQEWRFIELAPAVLRARSRNGADQHLAQNGDNLLRVIKRLVDNSPKLWSEVVRKFVERVPGVKGISVEETVDDFLAISFSDETLRSVFNSEWASDGSMQLLATLVLLHEEEPKSLLCVEEPENHVFPTVLNALAEDFELYTRREGDPQVIVTTHSPDFLDGVALESIFWLEKSTGVTRVHRATDDPQLVELAKVGDRPGALWRQGQFKGTVLP